MKYWTGDYRGSVACAVRARERRRRGAERPRPAAGRRGRRHGERGLGEHEVALEKLDAIMAVARELGAGAYPYLPNYQSVAFRELGDLAAARAANETALEASRDLPFGMPRRFALSDLLQTDLLAGDIGRAQADWPALWEDAAEATGWTRWLILGRLAVARSEIALHAEPAESAAEWAAKAVEVTVRTRRRKYEALARAHLGRRSSGSTAATTGCASLVRRSSSRTRSSTRSDGGRRARRSPRRWPRCGTRRGRPGRSVTRRGS